MLKYETQRIMLEGVQNARQLGGYIGTGGKRIKNNTILRTGMLFSASEAARSELSEKYRVSDIIDLRADNETKTMPEPEIKGARYHHLSVLNDLPVTEEDFKVTHTRERRIWIRRDIGRHRRVFLLRRRTFAAGSAWPNTHGLFEQHGSGSRGSAVPVTTFGRQLSS